LTLTQTVLTRWRAYGAIIYFLLKLQGFGINFQKSLQFFFILTLLNIENQLIKSFQQTLSISLLCAETLHATSLHGYGISFFIFHKAPAGRHLYLPKGHAYGI
jgi:hypothetical protein